MDVTLKNQFLLSSVEMFSEPFPHFISPEGFDENISLLLLDWLETGATWKLVETDFYEQYEVNFLDALLPSQLTFLHERSFLSELRTTIENLFQAKLTERIDVNAHKLIPGQRIRIHNDFIAGEETHRLLIQINRCWNEEQGGLLLFFNSQNPADIHKLIRPIHNSVAGFEISPHSYHAVSTIHQGERFTLVYSFYKE